VTEVHTYSAGEEGLLVNAYLVETDRGVVAIDGTLTASDSRALRSRIDSLGKPLLGVLVTHAHPDHVAGIANLLGDSGAPVVALESVRDLMRATEEAKRAQWGPVYGDEWIPRWVYPDRLVEDGEAVTFDGVAFRVHDVGPGGDCDANSVWVLEDEPAAAFVGDLVFNGTHSYIADGRVLRWLANLERFRALLEGVATLYPGHGRAGGAELLDAQKDYLLAYCAAVLEVAGDSATVDERAKEELAERMRRVLPGAPLEFMIGLSADAVAAELNGKDANQ
jgi:glyoxylase-like metal-dependent hydrolase (beta-lactamase superfamily II)